MSRFNFSVRSTRVLDCSKISEKMVELYSDVYKSPEKCSTFVMIPSLGGKSSLFRRFNVFLEKGRLSIYAYWFNHST